MLSSAAISISLTAGPLMPSTLMVYTDPLPPISLTDESFSFWLFSLIILNDCVTEPAVVKTVSYFIVSAVILNAASGLVINVSFLQAANKIKRDIVKPVRIFMRLKIKEHFES